MEDGLRTITRLFLRIELLFFIRHSHVCIWHLIRYEDCSAVGGGYECPACLYIQQRTANRWRALRRSSRRRFFRQIDGQARISGPITLLDTNTAARQSREIGQGQAEVRG
jgi:hypothetical protein